MLLCTCVALLFQELHNTSSGPHAKHRLAATQPRRQQSQPTHLTAAGPATAALRGHARGRHCDSRQTERADKVVVVVCWLMTVDHACTIAVFERVGAADLSSHAALHSGQHGQPPGQLGWLAAVRYQQACQTPLPDCGKTCFGSFHSILHQLMVFI